MSSRLEFLRFCLVGTVGFLVDTAVLYIVIWSEGGAYFGRIISYAVAATATWKMHRHFTFPNAHSAEPRRQWLEFVVFNAVGGSLNYGVYALIIATWSSGGLGPLVAVAVGSAAGLTLNYMTSRFIVFGSNRSRPT